MRSVTVRCVTSTSLTYSASPTLTPTKRIWFEGPVIPIPDSQRQEDYSADMSGTVAIEKNADLGPRRGWLFTAQGGAGGLVFVVGNLPEVVEKEIDGEPVADPIALPVTANGRIFPRDDLDLWEFDADAGQTVTALALAKSLNSPLVPRLEILDSDDRVLAEVHPPVRLVAAAAERADRRSRERFGARRGGSRSRLFSLLLRASRNSRQDGGAGQGNGANAAHGSFLPRCLG